MDWGDSTQEYEQFGQPAEPGVRAAMLDEALAILTGLWSGEAFSYHGSHYQVEGAQFTPAPLQKPHIPIWVAGFWPKRAPFRRAARYDGIFPGKMSGDMTPADLRELLTFVREHRTTDSNFDLAVMDATPGDKPEEAARIVAPFAEAGATWWLEPIHGWRAPLEEMRTRILQGPPVVR